MKEEVKLAKQWLGKADNDLLNVDNNLASEVIPFDTVCFHCQQAAEKMLKAYLIANERPYPVTHDLLLILEQVLSIDPNAQKLRDPLAVLMPYAVEVRYPDDLYMPTRADAIEARKATEQVRDWLKAACPVLW